MPSRFDEYIDRRLDLLIVTEGLNVPEFGRSLDSCLRTKIRDSFSKTYESNLGKTPLKR